MGWDNKKVVILFVGLALMFSFLWTASPVYGFLPFQFLPMVAFLRHRAGDGPWVAILSGLLLDLALGVPLGVFGFSLTAASFLFSELSRKVLLTPRASVIFLILYLAVKDLIALGILSAFSIRWTPSILGYFLTLLAYYPIYIKNERKFRET